MHDAWEGLLDIDSDDIYCQKWSEFLSTELSRSLVPNWQREFSNAELYFERAEDNVFEETNNGEREEWMHLADLCTNFEEASSETSESDKLYWQSFRENFTEEQIGNMVSWLEKKKLLMNY